MKKKSLEKESLEKGEEKKVSVSELERQIYEKEEVRVVIRAKSDTMVQGYDYSRCEPGRTSLSSWLERRVRPLVNEAEVTVVNGQGIQPHGRTSMAKLRDDYNVLDE